MRKLNIITGHIYNGVIHTIEKTNYSIVKKEVLNLINKGESVLDMDYIRLLPEEIIRLTRYIVKIVNSTDKEFTIRTNNDFVIREISNCILLNGVEKLDNVLKTTYHEHHKLYSKVVEAFYIDKKGNPERLIVSGVTGVWSTQLNRVIDNQNINQEKIVCRAKLH